MGWDTSLVPGIPLRIPPTWLFKARGPVTVAFIRPLCISSEQIRFAGQDPLT